MTKNNGTNKRFNLTYFLQNLKLLEFVQRMKVLSQPLIF